VWGTTKHFRANAGTAICPLCGEQLRRTTHNSVRGVRWYSIDGAGIFRDVDLLATESMRYAVPELLNTRRAKAIAEFEKRMADELRRTLAELRRIKFYGPNGEFRAMVPFGRCAVYHGLATHRAECGPDYWKLTKAARVMLGHVTESDAIDAATQELDAAVASDPLSQEAHDAANEATDLLCKDKPGHADAIAKAARKATMVQLVLAL
jgi:hypothetical protein